MPENRTTGVHNSLFWTTSHWAAAERMYGCEVKGYVVHEPFRAQTLGDLPHLFSNAVEVLPGILRAPVEVQFPAAQHQPTVRDVPPHTQQWECASRELALTEQARHFGPY